MVSMFEELAAREAAGPYPREELEAELAYLTRRLEEDAPDQSGQLHPSEAPQVTGVHGC